MPASAQAPLVTDGLNPWWQSFNDPVLLVLIDAARAASADLVSARARIERARAVRVAAQSLGQPQVGVGANFSSSKSGSTPTTTQAALGLQGAWEWDLFGAIAAGSQAADLRMQGQHHAWHGVWVAVASETAGTYTELRACQGQLEQARQDAVSRERTANLTARSAQAGFTAPADSALARAGAAQARNIALQFEAQCELLVKALVEATDIDEPALRQQLAATATVLPRPPALLPPTLPAALLAQRPDLAQAAQEVAAAAADVTQADARRRPQVSLAGRLGLFGVRTGGESNDGLTWTLGPLQVSFPMFDGGSRVANLQAARAGYDEAVSSYRALVRRAVREVESSLVSLQFTGRREGDAASAAQDLAVSVRAVESRQLGGLASLFELESARRDAFAAQSALIDLQKQRVLAWIDLYRALGGGWTLEQLNQDPMPVAKR